MSSSLISADWTGVLAVDLDHDGPTTRLSYAAIVAFACPEPIGTAEPVKAPGHRLVRLTDNPNGSGR